MKTPPLFKKLFLLVLLVAAGSFSQRAMAQEDTIATCSTRTQPLYKHSVGGCAGYIGGLSMKFNLKGNVYLQTDWGVTGHLSLLYPYIGELGPMLYLGIGGDVSFLYEKKFRNATNTWWLAGVNLLGDKHLFDNGLKTGYWRTGARIVLGLEWRLDVPICFQLEARQGYGLIFAPDWDEHDYSRDKYWSFCGSPYHFFDFSMVFSVRYCFGKYKDKLL
jgi:hypothetical protein